MGCCCSVEILDNNKEIGLNINNSNLEITYSDEVKIDEEVEEYYPYSFIFTKELEHGATSVVWKTKNYKGENFICKRIKKKYIKKAEIEIQVLKTLKKDNRYFPEYIYHFKDLLYTNIFLYDTGGIDLFKFITSFNISNILKEDFIIQMLYSIYFLQGNGYMHLDIKPENFIVYGDRKLMLIDFGCCHEIKENISNLMYEVGTIGYNAPEIYNYKYHYTTDYWSWAICVWILYAEDTPFNFRNPKLDIKNNFKFPEEKHHKELNKMAEDQRELFINIFKPYDKRYNFDDIINNDWIKSI